MSESVSDLVFRAAHAAAWSAVASPVRVAATRFPASARAGGVR